MLMDVGPVLGLEDSVGLKVRALHDRGMARDFIDIHASKRYFSEREMEQLGARHDDEFSLEELADRLGGIQFINDIEFLAYGTTAEDISAIRHWSLDWQTDISERIAEERAVNNSLDELFD